MPQTKYQLTKEGIEALEKMSHEGAKKASESLSKLINVPLEVKSLAIRTLPVEKIPEIVGSPEEMVTTVIMKVRKDVYGTVMLIFPQQAALRTADFLAKRQPESIAQLDELDKSALKETGNILAGAFFSAMSNYLNINMVESIPDIATDMLKSTIDFVLAGFIKEKKGEAVAFEIDFEIGFVATATAVIRAYFFLLLDIESAAKVLSSLKKISGGKKMTKGGL